MLQHHALNLTHKLKSARKQGSATGADLTLVMGVTVETPQIIWRGKTAILVIKVQDKEENLS